MRFINREMCKKDLAGMFATAALAILDPLQSDFQYSSAGHPPPLMRHATGSVVELASDQSPGLAITPDAQFVSHRLHLQPGDALLLYTDGLIEAVDETGRYFGIERLRHVFSEADGSPREMADFINRVVAAHRGLEEQPDDKTFIVIRARETDGGMADTSGGG
jgi:sigma-B regulation protein RsbU (phosphoserine phosphatase)